MGEKIRKIKVEPKIGLWTQISDLNGAIADINLGHSVWNWIIAIGVGIFFLVSVFGSIILSPSNTIGIIFFWIVLFLLWPKEHKGWRYKFTYIVLQVAFCFLFTLIDIYVGKWLHSVFNVGAFKILYICVGLPIWYVLSALAVRCFLHPAIPR